MGAFICLAKVPLMSAALRQSKDSRKFLDDTSNKNVLTAKTKICTLLPISILVRNIIKKKCGMIHCKTWAGVPYPTERQFIAVIMKAIVYVL